MHLIKALVVTVALVMATPVVSHETQTRYRLDVSVVRNGVEIASISTGITEDAPTTASMNAGGMTYEFEASLFTLQGDGDAAQLAMEAHLSRGDEEIAAPRLTLQRGSPAQIAVGDERGDIMSLTLSPIV